MKAEDLLREVAQAGAAERVDAPPAGAPDDDAILRPLDAAESAQILDAVLASVELRPQPRKSPPKRWFAAAGGFAAAAAAALFFFIAPPSGEEGFTPRSAGTAPSLSVLEVGADGKATPLGATLAQGRPLTFVYSNPKASPQRFIAVVGRDETGRVHWYHPMYRAGEQPRSVAIQAGDIDVQLPDAVRNAHAPGALQICALFTDSPLDVVEVDRKLEAGGAWPEAGARHCLDVEVLP